MQECSVIQSQMDPLLLSQKYSTQNLILILFVQRLPTPEFTDLHCNAVTIAHCVLALQCDRTIRSVVSLKSTDGHPILRSFSFFIKFPEPLKNCLAVWLSNFTSRKLTPKEMTTDIKYKQNVITHYWKPPKYPIVGYFRQASYNVFIINTILISYMVVFHHQRNGLEIA